MSKLEELIEKLCPDGVEYKYLADVVTIKRGVRLIKKELKDNAKYPVYQNSLIPLGYYDDYNCEANKTMIITAGAAGDIVYSNTKFWAADDCFYFICNRYIDDKFLYYVLMSQQRGIYSKVRKASIPRLPRIVIEKIKLPVPPLEVQREIVRILDNFTFLTTELAAELAARQKQYEYFRDLLLNDCNGTNGKIIDMLVQPITDGPHTTPTLVSSGIPFVSAEAIFDGHVNFEKKRGFITEKFHLECCRKYKPQKNDVYLVKSGSTTGKVAYVYTDEEFNIWSPIAALRTNADNSSRFLFHLLQSNKIQQQVKSKSSHGSQPNLSMRVLEQFDVVIPSLEKQNQIANLLDRFDVLCNDISSGLPAEIEMRQKQYEYYRDKLLSFKELKKEA